MKLKKKEIGNYLKIKKKVEKIRKNIKLKKKKHVGIQKIVNEEKRKYKFEN